MRVSGGGAFQDELRREVARYFEASGRRQRDVPRMIAKTAVILAWFVASWWLLVFHASSVLATVGLAVSLGLAVAGIGMGIQHDANHGAYSEHRGVNRALGFLLDVLGASSYVWRVKHNVVHHTYTNVPGADDDLDVGPWARLSPGHERRALHRFQHLYLWALYGLLHPKWVFVDDFQCLLEGKVAQQKLNRPSRGEMAALLAGKAIFWTWSLVIPALYHPLWQVVAVYFLASAVVGVVLAVTFQLAHCVDAAEFPPAMEQSFAAHQVATTVDFARRNPLLTWYMGGLNYQVEHHLFPRVCHVHYPVLSEIVARVAARHGIAYREHRTFGAALASHYRHLRALGRPGEVPVATRGEPVAAPALRRAA